MGIADWPDRVSDVFLGRVSEANWVQAHAVAACVRRWNVPSGRQRCEIIYGAIVCGCARTTRAVTEPPDSTCAQTDVVPPQRQPRICPSMKGSGVNLNQYSETLLRASRARSGMRWAVEAAFSRAKLDRWMNCPVRRAAIHYAEDMIMTSMLNSLWYLPFAKPADWSSVDEAVQSQYSGQSAHKCPTLLIDYFSQKMGPR